MSRVVKNCLSYALKIDEGLTLEERHFAPEEALDPKVSVFPELEVIASNHNRSIRFVGKTLEDAENADLDSDEWLICLFGFWTEQYSTFGCDYEVVDYHFVRQDNGNKWSQIDLYNQTPKPAYIDHMINYCGYEKISRHEFYAVKICG